MASTWKDLLHYMLMNTCDQHQNTLTVGIRLSFQPSCFNVLLPFLPLHLLHAVTKLDHSQSPPLETGLTWSTVKSDPQPQYLDLITNITKRFPHSLHAEQVEHAVTVYYVLTGKCCCPAIAGCAGSERFCPCCLGECTCVHGAQQVS